MSELLWPQLTNQFPPDQVPWTPEEIAMDEPRPLAMLLAYDGTRYSGWQVQPGKRTIQGILEKILSKLNNQPVRVISSGRTDAGVHAFGQVAVFHTNHRLPISRMLLGLRGLLPPDVYVRRLDLVSPEFHPRFQAVAKTYDYFLRFGLPQGPFLNHNLWCLPFNLDLAAMDRCLELLLGVWDFKLLAGPRCFVRGCTAREILSARLNMDNPQSVVRIQITASGFLRHVMRNLVGLLVQVGRGRLKPEDLPGMLKSGNRSLNGPKAPPGGLYLNKVWYQPYRRSEHPAE